MHGNDPLNELTLEELQIQLNDALENEDYELASKIRDEISQRKK
jgi:protein-arginine kinase activator protein McsA